MKQYKEMPLQAKEAICPECGEKSRGRIGVHSQKERRDKCHACGGRFSDRYGTPLYGLKHPQWLVVIVLTLLAHGCPPQAIVAAFRLDERTVTFPIWLPAATRKTRTPAARRRRLEAAFFWTAVVYNFSHIHASLQTTPAMAAGLTDSVWSIDQLLRFRPHRE
jgi:transposase-like protein